MTRRRAALRSEYLEQFTTRLIQDAIAHATPATWIRRGDLFTWARPRPDDYTGRATPAEIDDRDRRLAALARACYHRATLSDPSALPESDRHLIEQLVTGAAA